MDETFAKVYELHKARLDFANTGRGARLIVFSAVPGSGKSVLSRRLAADFGYLRIANKDIREILRFLYLENTIDPVDYTLWLLSYLTAKQTIDIVLDRNIDQVYAPLRNWVNTHDYHLITVGIEVKRDILDKRLILRERSDNGRVFSVASFYDEQHLKGFQDISRDIIFEDNYDLKVAATRIANF